VQPHSLRICLSHSTIYLITEDRDLVIQGHLPSPTTELDDNARAKRSDCATYYLLSSEGEMACKDAAGTVVATNIRSDYLKRAMVRNLDHHEHVHHSDVCL
jgi:hypothetical protein